MASGSRRVSSEQIRADRASLRAIKNLADYAPSNSGISISTMAQLDTTLQEAEEHEERIEKTLSAARSDKMLAAEALHKAIRSAKSQVRAQYGDDSNEVKSVGLKKESEYKRRSLRKPNN